MGKVTTFTYDSFGNVLTVKNPLNQTTIYTYDYRNRVTSMTDPVGSVTGYTYDNNSNLLTSTDALGKVTTYGYDAEDRLQTTKDALNRTTTYGRDNVGRLVSVTDPANNVTSYEYDSAGQLTAVVDALGKRTTTGYDVRGLLTGVTDPLGRSSSFTYDDLGRRITAKDPLNRVTGLGYDALNRLQQVTDPASLVAQQGFDNDGNRILLTNPANAATAFAYDLGDRLATTTTAAGHATTLAYDARSLLSTITQPSTHATTLSYDDAARLSSTSDLVGTISLTRDADGRVLTVTEGSKTLTRVYDVLGRLTSYTDGDGNVIGYAYDDIGRLTTLTYPDSKQVTYAYDTAGRLSTVTDWASRVTTYGYDAVGRMTQVVRPNGTKQTRAYDAAGQLTQVYEFAPDGTTLLYSGDHMYDLAGQLIGDTLVPKIIPASTSINQTFDADNRLLTHNGAATTFDADGNLLSVASGLLPAAYSYDARNRLTSAGGLTYAYDAEDRRVALTDSSGTTHYAINPNAALDQVLVRTAPNGTKTFYVYGLGLLHEDNGSSVHYYHHDRRGDTIALTDSTATVTDRVSYGVYGELIARTGTTSTPFLFSGRWGVQFDPNGIYYHRARYYHPGLRRFMNQDILLGSVSISTGMNRFAYAGGNPISFNDPSGLWFGVDDAIFAGVGAIVGVGGQLVADLVTGHDSTWKDYTGAALGGAAGAEVLLYTANPFAAGAASGLVSNGSTQLLNIATGSQESLNATALVANTAFGAATGFIPGMKIPGVNVGQGSELAIFKQIVTKASNGTIDSVTAQTATRMADGAFAEWAIPQGAAAASLFSDLTDDSWGKLRFYFTPPFNQSLEKKNCP